MNLKKWFGDDNLPEEFSDDNSLEQFPDDNLLEQFPIVEPKGLAFWQNWLACINQHLRPGGKPVAIILSLGVISVPLLAFSGSIWVGPILATGATLVAIRGCWL